jgi:lysophospholipase L1-like esterase
MRHRRDGFLFYPSGAEAWAPADRAGLQSDYEANGLLSVDAALNNLAAVVAKIRRHSEVPILIYNLSPIIPGDQIHCYAGVGETFSTRIRKFNLALAGLSEDTGISIIDVDAIVARHGADALKLDAVHLKPQGYLLLAEEVVRVLDDLGVLDTATQ